MIHRVWGVGPTYAETFYNRGFRTLNDLRLVCTLDMVFRRFPDAYRVTSSKSRLFPITLVKDKGRVDAAAKNRIEAF